MLGEVGTCESAFDELSRRRATVVSCEKRSVRKRKRQGRTPVPLSTTMGREEDAIAGERARARAKLAFFRE